MADRHRPDEAENYPDAVGCRGDREVELQLEHPGDCPWEAHQTQTGAFQQARLAENHTAVRQARSADASAAASVAADLRRKAARMVHQVAEGQQAQADATRIRLRQE